jgi:hypothetical protein
MRYLLQAWPVPIQSVAFAPHSADLDKQIRADKMSGVDEATKYSRLLDNLRRTEDLACL